MHHGKNRRLAALALAMALPGTARATARPPEEPWEKIPGVETHVRLVEVGGGVRLLTAIAHATEAPDTPLHPILFTQWVSCGSLAYRTKSGAREILAALARDSGRALVRVERAGTGRSGGPDCSELDYDTELAHYVAAYRILLEDPRLDTSKVFIYGSSLGSTTAPLLARALAAEGYAVTRVAVQGGGAVTYLERMLTFERHYLERRPERVPRGAIHDEFMDRTRFLLAYLGDGEHPDAIAKKSARMARVRGDILGLGKTTHYGRPFAWHQQAAKRNFLGAWAALEAEVLVIYNAFDQFEGPRGHALIAETVNARRPGSARLIVQEQTGHSNERYDTVEAAYTMKGGTPAWATTAGHLVSFFRRP